MQISELVSPVGSDAPVLHYLGGFIRRHGVDLCSDGAPQTLPRGTSVFVNADADPIEVQRRMAETHVRSVVVLSGDDVLGIVDLVALADGAEEWALAGLGAGGPG